MHGLDWLAAFLFFLLFPVPVFWLVLHPWMGFWRRQPMRRAYGFAGLTAWGTGLAFLLWIGERLFASERAPLWAILAGFALVAADGFTIARVSRELGRDRLVGKAELSGGGRLVTTGLYGRVRHPRYAAMMGSMLGICLMAGTSLMWATAAVWLLLTLAAITFEERELDARFGLAYREYRQRVPAFLPFRVGPQAK